MKIFPESDYNFKITGNEVEALDRLKRRTEFSKSLTSQITDKSFRGIIENNTFTIISSEIGKGAFCVLKGKIDNQVGQLNISINKAFQILLSVILCFPVVLLITDLISEKGRFSIMTLLTVILMFILIRFLFIEIAFRRLSKSSINRLSDILDIERIEKTRHNHKFVL
ncbi:hypothetical protein [Pedobacter puniceum]|uniref:Uncharacterized protein n=1 Tax=Pedobacter puniceum TaxID=2666136 RepID=A0A7K0FQ03_9SPHI|nr:hypothetical protein [Pedobacter puniceum]MRX47127.1 hypothetical protein [Pedobacter puniceum]